MSKMCVFAYDNNLDPCNIYFKSRIRGIGFSNRKACIVSMAISRIIFKMTTMIRILFRN